MHQTALSNFFLLYTFLVIFYINFFFRFFFYFLNYHTFSDLFCCTVSSSFFFVFLFSCVWFTDDVVVQLDFFWCYNKHFYPAYSGFLLFQACLSSFYISPILFSLSIFLYNFLSIFFFPLHTFFTFKFLFIYFFFFSKIFGVIFFSFTSWRA